MSIEAMKQALEALATCQVAYPGTRFKSKDFAESTVQDAITTLRTAIEQAEKQEPVACDTPKYCSSVARCTAADERRATPPAAPVQDECVVCGDKVRVIPRPWVGLTDKERDEICLGDESIARYIEAKLKEKNT